MKLRILVVLGSVLTVSPLMARSDMEHEEASYRFKVAELNALYARDIARAALTGDEQGSAEKSLEWKQKLATAALEHNQYVQQLQCGWKLAFRAGWEREREMLRYSQAVASRQLAHRYMLAQIDPRDVNRIALEKLRQGHELDEIELAHNLALERIALEAAWDGALCQACSDAGSLGSRLLKELQEKELRYKTQISVVQRVSQHKQAELQLQIDQLQTELMEAGIRAPKGSRDTVRETVLNDLLRNLRENLAREQTALRHYVEREELAFAYERRISQPAAMVVRTAPTDHACAKAAWMAGDNDHDRQMAELEYRRAVQWAALLHQQAVDRADAENNLNARRSADIDRDYAVAKAESARALKLEEIAARRCD